MKIFMVGGCVRDEILGRHSKDIDFSVVVEPKDQHPGDPDFSFAPHDPFEVMKRKLEFAGFKIFTENKEHLVIRAHVPKNEGWVFADLPANTTADFVLARKEGTYSDGRRPDTVEPGTLHDDLARRDFTMNAIAKDEFGNFHDPFNGRADIAAHMIRAVGSPEDRFSEDALRILRAFRFSATLGFWIEKNTFEAAQAMKHLILPTVKKERVQEELKKMFKHDTKSAINAMEQYGLWDLAIEAGIKFAPTLGAVK